MPRDDAASRLPRSVWLIGWVSLATDAASEAIYPLLPFFLTQVLGAGAISLGVIEGAAEAVNSLLKILAGQAADKARAKRPLVLAGYAISSAIRPFIALAQGWTTVLGIRVLDRVGKGIRGAPRDAMLASMATPHTRGRIFGFHRAMDHAGAVIGPVFASIFLFFRPGDYRTLFGLTIVPGAIAVGLILLIKEDGQVERVGRVSQVGQVVGLGLAGQDAVEPMPRRLVAFFTVLSLFMLGSSSDAFLLLRLTEAAGSAAFIPLMWAALHVVKSSSSVIAGQWSDRVGRRGIIAAGWLVYAAVYAGFAVSTTLTPLLAWFMVYGLYFGLTEGVEKALVADLAPATRRGFAFGVYNAVIGAGSLAASIVFGLIWSAYGAPAAFGAGAALALVSTILLFFTI